MRIHLQCIPENRFFATQKIDIHYHYYNMNRFSPYLQNLINYYQWRTKIKRVHPDLIVLRRDICSRCGFILDGIKTTSAVEAKFHPAWHEIEWADCTTCERKIWNGDCYDFDQPFPTDVDWGGWGAGSFKEGNLQCEHCVIGF